MNPVLRNILAVIGGWIGGSIVNMGIVMISPVPEGVDPMNMESIKENMHLFETKHYIMPFLAHALGTLAGAFLAAKIAVSRHMMLALMVGAIFMLGGIANAFMLPGPMWFNVVDIVAYIPMAYLGFKLSKK